MRENVYIVFLYSIGIVVSLLLFSSCDRHVNDGNIEVSFFPEIYPYVDTVYSKHNNTIDFLEFGGKENAKLLMYVYGDCSACFAKIIEFYDFVEDNRGVLDGVSCAIVAYSENVEILGYNLENLDNTLPIYVDTLQKFSTYNSLPLMESYMILVDKENKGLYYTQELSGNTKYHRRMIRKSLNR